jgi:glyoxylate carboligase
MNKDDKAWLLGSVKTHTPSLEELRKPLSPGKIAKVFCTECGNISEADKDGVFVLLALAKEEKMNAQLDGKIDWSKNYIQANHCNNCNKSSRSYRAKIKDFPSH